MGELRSAWEPIANAQAIGETIGDPRILCYAGWSKGVAATFSGDWKTGIAACQESLARSPDPVNTAVAMMSLGEAYRTKGDAAAAIHWLEQSVESMSRFGFRSMQSWSQALLAEAHRMLDNLARARELASQALDISQDIKYWYGVGVAQHTLGRIALSEGSLADAERFLHEAQQTFATIQCRYWVARNHLDQAALAHAQVNPEAAASHLQEAKALFTALELPKFIKRAEDIAAEYRVPLEKE